MTLKTGHAYYVVQDGRKLTGAFDLKSEANEALRRFKKRAKEIGQPVRGMRIKQVKLFPNPTRERKRATKARAPSVKMRKAPRGWIKAKAVRVVRRGGKRIVEVLR